jgi:hypothetical protein
MQAEAQRRLGHALQAIQANHTYTADAPLPELESLLEACARLRDWQHPVAVEELVGFVAGDLQVWQGRLMESSQQFRRGGEVGSADCREPEEVGV